VAVRWASIVGRYPVCDGCAREDHEDRCQMGGPARLACPCHFRGLYLHRRGPVRGVSESDRTDAEGKRPSGGIFPDGRGAGPGLEVGVLGGRWSLLRVTCRSASSRAGFCRASSVSFRRLPVCLSGVGFCPDPLGMASLLAGKYLSQGCWPGVRAVSWFGRAVATLMRIRRRGGRGARHWNGLLALTTGRRRSGRVVDEANLQPNRFGQSAGRVLGKR